MQAHAGGRLAHDREPADTAGATRVTGMDGSPLGSTGYPRGFRSSCVGGRCLLPPGVQAPSLASWPLPLRSSFGRLPSRRTPQSQGRADGFPVYLTAGAGPCFPEAPWCTARNTASIAHHQGTRAEGLVSLCVWRCRVGSSNARSGIAACNSGSSSRVPRSEHCRGRGDPDQRSPTQHDPARGRGPLWNPIALGTELTRLGIGLVCVSARGLA
jgi:hypothetical protein